MLAAQLPPNTTIFLKSVKILNPEAANLTPQQIARFFRLLGWIGFWLQSLLGFIPILVVVTAVLFNPNNQRSGGLSFGLFSAIACLVLLIFSIYWCFRYTRLANKLEIPDLRPAKSQVIRDLKLGLSANIGSMAIAVLIDLQNARCTSRLDRDRTQSNQDNGNPRGTDRTI